jgi:hypothetical protein
MTRSSIELASGQVAPADTLTIELVKPSDMPAVVIIRWPARPTVSDPRRFAEAASATMRILATAMTRLTQIRGQQL